MVQCLTYSKALTAKDDGKGENDDENDDGRSSFDSLGHCAPFSLSSDCVSDSLSWGGGREGAVLSENGHCKNPES